MTAIAHPEQQAPPAPPPEPPQRRLWVLDALIGLAILAVIGFPLLAKLAADRQPMMPRKGAVLPRLPAHARGGSLTQLPAGMKPGPAPARIADLRPQAVALLGQRGGEQWLRAVSAPTTPVPHGNDWSYPELDRVLPARFTPAQGAAAVDLAGRMLVLLAHGTDPDGSVGHGAYALLTRAGGCAAQLDLFAVRAADYSSAPPDAAATADPVAVQAARAIRACPGDPTARWLFAQYQSLTDDATAALRALRHAFPASAAAWSAEADDIVRHSQVDPTHFTSRRRYARALARYQRAQRLQPSPELELGVAAALHGLGREAQAARVQARALSALGRPLDALQIDQLTYLESAHRFAAAARAAGALAVSRRVTSPGPGLFPDIPSEQPRLLLSLGAQRLRPFSVVLGNSSTGASGVFVESETFLPPYRQEALVGSQPECATWSQRRDTLLAGSPAAAVAGLPRAFSSIPETGTDCPNPKPLAAVAALELGGGGTDVAQEERQNVWRWAGNLPRAQAAAQQWVQSRPHDARPQQRLGEIQYLRRDFDDAAVSFDLAVRKARRAHATWSAAEAQALLDRGAALIHAGRLDDGLASLREADEVASRSHDEIDRFDGTQLSAVALGQAADAERGAHRFKAAADDYATSIAVAGHDGEIDNNFAVVSQLLHRPGAAALAQRALRTDPASPLFEMTTAGTMPPSAAIPLLRSALATDPTSYPAANDLGVLLARAGREREAVTALRRAIGANPDYALGWFNLGVVLSRMGLAHLPASQGALGRAVSLDSSFDNRRRVLTEDNRTYDSGLDISRPVPPKWNFAASQKHTPSKTAGLVAILLLAFGTSRTLAARRSGRALADDWLERLNAVTDKVPVLRVLKRPAIAVVATFGVFLYGARGGGLLPTLALAGGIALLVALAVRVRRDRRQQGWPPGIVFGVGAAFGGLLWAPLPVLRDDASLKAHRAAPLALAGLAIPLVLLAVWTDVPVTRALAAAALVMAASALTPVKPVDGGALAAAGGAAAALTGAGLAVLLLLGLV